MRVPAYNALTGVMQYIDKGKKEWDGLEFYENTGIALFFDFAFFTDKKIAELGLKQGQSG